MTVGHTFDEYEEDNKDNNPGTLESLRIKIETCGMNAISLSFSLLISFYYNFLRSNRFISFDQELPRNNLWNPWQLEND